MCRQITFLLLALINQIGHCNEHETHGGSVKIVIECRASGSVHPGGCNHHCVISYASEKSFAAAGLNGMWTEMR